MQLVVWLALLVAVTSYISSLSTTQIGNFIWGLYIKYSPSADVAEVRAKRERLSELKAQRSSTSSKDEFAKWAKLDREHRRTKTEIEQLDAKLGVTRQKLQQVVRIARWSSTTGLKLFVQWRYRKVPVMKLPHNVLPSSVEWFLSLPSAPKGSVSVATSISITSTALSTILTNFKTLKALIKP